MINLFKYNKMETIKDLFFKYLRKLCLFFRREIPARVTFTETVLSSSTNISEIDTIFRNCTDKGSNVTYVNSEEELLNLYKDGK